MIFASQEEKNSQYCLTSFVEVNPDGDVASKEKHMLAIMVLKCNGFIYLKWAEEGKNTIEFLSLFFHLSMEENGLQLA